MAEWQRTLEKMVMDVNFWQGKKVLVTGHTGFKGSWLSLWLQKLGAQVVGFSLNPPTSPNLFECAGVADNMVSVIGDIRSLDALKRLFIEEEPEVVFHLAAQALVRDSYDDPVTTYSTNFIGSMNLLEAVRETKSVKSVVMVSTDKCYENQELNRGYKENDPLGGFDPYSCSKACLELMVASYQKSFFPLSKYNSHGVGIATARAGNVIGGGDWAKDRLVPDILNAIKHNNPITLRYPNAVRPWQHVLEPLSGYLLLAEKLFQQGDIYSQSWNFGPDVDSAKSVHWLTRYLLDHIPNSSELIMQNKNEPHETKFLKLDCSRVAEQLHWYPRWSIEEALDNLIVWSKAFGTTNQNLKDICFKQIQVYSEITD